MTARSRGSLFNCSVTGPDGGRGAPFHDDGLEGWLNDPGLRGQLNFIFWGCGGCTGICVCEVRPKNLSSSGFGKEGRSPTIGFFKNSFSAISGGGGSSPTIGRFKNSLKFGSGSIDGRTIGLFPVNTLSSF